MELNKWRLMHLAAAEAVDAWRIVPRLMVAGYAYMLAYMVYWYMQLKPYVLTECVNALGSEVAAGMATCLINEPSTQHTALITAIVGISAGVFGFYANSGRNWSAGVFKWPIKQYDAMQPPPYGMPPPPPPYGMPPQPYDQTYGQPQGMPEMPPQPPPPGSYT